VSFRRIVQFICTHQTTVAFRLTGIDFPSSYGVPPQDPKRESDGHPPTSSWNR